MLCPNCATENVADAKFCGNCGTPLSAAAPQPEAPATPEAPAAPEAPAVPEAPAAPAAPVPPAAPTATAAPIPPAAPVPPVAPQQYAAAQQPVAPQPYAAATQQPYAAPLPPYGAPMSEQTYVVEGSNQTLRLIAFIMNIVALVTIGIVGIGTLGLGLIPLAWGIPMTVRSWGVYKGKKPNTVALGVCTLLFLNMVSGILLLVAQKDK